MTIVFCAFCAPKHKTQNTENTENTTTQLTHALAQGNGHDPAILCCPLADNLLRVLRLPERN